MKKVFFIIALLVGLGITQAFASDMQPPGDDITLVVNACDVISLEMQTPVIYQAITFTVQEAPVALLNLQADNAAIDYLVTSYEVPIDVITGSSGGIADHFVTSGAKLLPCKWTQIEQRCCTNQTGYTQHRQRCEIPLYSLNCNLRFPLI
jgi:hypothetical protein